jgi:hypothetical protein
MDSVKTIQIATAQPLLKNLALKATQLRLEHGDTGPQWRIKLWAAKLKNSSDDTDIGIVILSSETVQSSRPIYIRTVWID